MGKQKRVRIERHELSLAEQMEDPEEGFGKIKEGRSEKRQKSKKYKRRQERDSEDEGGDDGPIPKDLSGRILQTAREQQAEIDADERQTTLLGTTQTALAAAIQSLGKTGEDSDSEEELSDNDGEWDEDWEDEINAEDEAALAAFMTSGADGHKQKTLSDVIFEKIREKQALEGIEHSKNERQGDDLGQDLYRAMPLPSGLDPKVVEVYRGVGELLSRYTSGKVPKAFKVIPNLQNWEEILFLTNPESWSPHAVYQATRMFVSNLNARMAQRFLALVLLPAVRSDIQKNHRLHFALFQSLKKATYKAGAFYKGLLLPLCASGTCTLREAVIFTSVLRRTSIPVLHSAAALLRISEMPYSGVNSFFIRVLLDKKYALPYRVIDALVDHFTSFTVEQRTMPVVWHQALLCFVQRYKKEIRREDKDSLRKLCQAQHHYLVTPEVLRELDSSSSRGEVSQSVVPASFGQHVKEDPRDLAPIILMDE